MINEDRLTDESVKILELKKVLDLHLVRDSQGGYETISGVRTETKTVYIGPELAELLLLRNDKNRPIDRANVFRLVTAMVNGEWVFDGTPITFDKYGKLLDGQHRLMAIIKSGKILAFRVSYGFNPEVFTTMNIGKIRTGSDVLAIAGYENPKIYALTANFVFRFSRGVVAEVGGYNTNHACNLTHPELLDYCKVTPRIKSSVDFYVKIKKKLHGSSIIPSNLITGLHYLFSEKDELLAEIFLTKLLIGDDLSHGSPILSVRNRLISSKLDKNKYLTQSEVIRLTINGWNKSREGKNVKLVTIPEKLPTII